MHSITVHAPAKLNLFLHITGKRADGYHLIHSLVVFTEFGDTLQCKSADGISLEITGEFAPALADDTANNLVLKAAQLLSPYAKGQGAHITLHKNIPMGAGLGGGSADAAAVLHALCDLWKLSIDRQALMDMALTLGSDVPVCYDAKAALISGIGEKITPVSWHEDMWVLLVNPRKPLLTADVYKKSGGKTVEEGANNNIDIKAIHSHTRNMLEAPAIAMMPEIQDIIGTISSASGCQLARMSGSGATCFGVFDSRQNLKTAEAAIRKNFPSYWVTATRTKNGR